VVVDNASTDGTTEVVGTFAAEHPGFDLRVIHESEKGTGAASDTGMRYAIDQGATLPARTWLDDGRAPRVRRGAAIRRRPDPGADRRLPGDGSRTRGPHRGGVARPGRGAVAPGASTDAAPILYAFNALPDLLDAAPTKKVPAAAYAGTGVQVVA
jgi:hypothetical protein